MPSTEWAAVRLQAAARGFLARHLARAARKQSRPTSRVQPREDVVAIKRRRRAASSKGAWKRWRNPIGGAGAILPRGMANREGVGANFARRHVWRGWRCCGPTRRHSRTARRGCSHARRHKRKQARAARARSGRRRDTQRQAGAVKTAARGQPGVRMAGYPAFSSAGGTIFDTDGASPGCSVRLRLQLLCSAEGAWLVSCFGFDGENRWTGGPLQPFVSSPRASTS